MQSISHVSGSPCVKPEAPLCFMFSGIFVRNVTFQDLQVSLECDEMETFVWICIHLQLIHLLSFEPIVFLGSRYHAPAIPSHRRVHLSFHIYLKMLGAKFQAFCGPVKRLGNVVITCLFDRFPPSWNEWCRVRLCCFESEQNWRVRPELSQEKWRWSREKTLASFYDDKTPWWMKEEKSMWPNQVQRKLFVFANSDPLGRWVRGKVGSGY